MSSDWTPELVKDYVDALREADQRAIDIAAEMLGQRLEQMNEFRDQIQTERTEFARRDYIEQRVSTTNARIAAVEKWQAKIVGGLVLATVIAPLLTALIVYLLTRHAIPTTR